MPDEEAPIYNPDLFNIDPDKDGLPGIMPSAYGRFFKNREIELAEKIIEVEGNPKKIGWIVYGWLLNTINEAEKIRKYVEDIPVLGFLLKWYCKVMGWQAKRLKVS